MWRKTGALAALGLTVIALLAVARAPREAEAAATLYVTSSADSGPGSLREAIDAANGDPGVSLIVLKNRLPVTLTASLVYTGPQALTLRGDQPAAYRVVQGSSTVPGNPDVEPLDCGMFKSTGGADITFQQLTIQNSWCDALNIVPLVGDSEVAITLTKVVLRDNFGSGLFLHEVEAAEATVRLNVTATQVTDNGRCRGAAGCAFGGIEIEGLGEGELAIQLSGAAFNGNGGNGLSLSWSEVDATTTPAPPLDVDITVTATGATFNDNGRGVSRAAAASGAGGRGDASVASHQAGDGLSLYGDGLGTGDVSVTLTDVQARANAADGVFLAEVDDGALTLTATSVTASSNGSRGIALFEDGAGGVRGALASVATWHNGDAGVSVDERDEGSLDLDVRNSSAGFNDSSGFEAHESGGGPLAARFRGAVVSGNAADGLSIEERDAGAASVAVQSAAIAGNGDAAIAFAAEDETGTVAVVGSFIVGPLVLNNVVAVP